MVGETSQAINALACFASQGEFKLLLLSMEEFEMRCCAAVQLQGQEGILTSSHMLILPTRPVLLLYLSSNGFGSPQISRRL